MVLYYIMYFEYELPCGIKSKKSNVVNEERLEIEPELEKVEEEQVTVSAKWHNPSFLFYADCRFFSANVYMLPLEFILIE